MYIGQRRRVGTLFRALRTHTSIRTYKISKLCARQTYSFGGTRYAHWGLG